MAGLVECTMLIMYYDWEVYCCLLVQNPDSFTEWFKIKL